MELLQVYFFKVSNFRAYGLMAKDTAAIPQKNLHASC